MRCSLLLMSSISVSIPACAFPTVKDAFKKARISFSDVNPNAILIWFDSLKEGDKVFNHVKPWQVANRIPNINVICRKAPFTRIIQRIQPFFPDLFTFMPKSYILPFKNETFVRATQKNQCRYIIKPDGGSLGQGIRILEPDIEYSPDDTMAVAQEYIESYTLDKKKFDLRIYALIASVKPLRFYIYQDGLARFCSEETGGVSMQSKLTNVAINHDSRPLTKILERLKNEKNVNVEELWKKIEDAIGLTIIAGSQFIEIGEQNICPQYAYPRCFQILGFDILLSEDLHPYVLEVNYRPSLDTHNGPERRMKINMIKDAVSIGCPLQIAQACLFTQKWSWTEKGWKEFISSNPEIMESYYRSQKNAEQCSRFKLLWPTTDPDREVWYEVFQKAQELSTEQVPGFSVPKANIESGSD